MALAFIKEIIDDINSIKSTRKNLREFAFLIGFIVILVGGYALIWKGRYFGRYWISIGIVFAILGLFTPWVFRPLQKIWMAFSVIIGFFMSRIILAILFYAVFTPINLLVVKILRKDILDERIDRNAKSYWKERKTVPDRESYPNQY